MVENKNSQPHQEVKRSIILKMHPENLSYHKAQFGELPEFLCPSMRNSETSLDENSLYALGVTSMDVYSLIDSIEDAWTNDYDAGMKVKKGKKGKQLIARIVGYSKPYATIPGEQNTVTIFVELDASNLPGKPTAANAA